MHIIHGFYCCAIVLTLISCMGKGTPSEQNAKNNAQQVAAPVEVTVAEAQVKNFSLELLCNGILSASSSAKVGFELQGRINKVLVKGGQQVVKGQLLATIESAAQQLALDRAKNSLALAEVEMQNILLGYSLNVDTASLSPQVLNTARTRSGYNEALLAVREAQLQLDKTSIKSPISGTVVDLLAKENHPTGAYDYCCQIVDEQSLQVEFSVLETELNMAALGANVEVFPFTSPADRQMAVITEVNRMVDKSGMVKVVARLNSTSHKFIVGMNVRAIIRNQQKNKLVIPAEALTLRQNRDVVFVAVDSLASWKYVEVGPRNSSEVVINSGISSGDLVIVSGNATIGHEAWIKY